MKRMLLLRLIGVLLLCSHHIQAQSGIKPGQRTENHIVDQERYDYQNLFDELRGTFQFRIFNTERKPLLSLALLKEIKAARHESETVILSHDENTNVVIFPENDLNAINPDEVEMYVFVKVD